jgi:hypothetical protein
MDKLRDEILPTITYSGDGATRKATLDIRTLEKECPTLLGCQREGIRVSNHMVARRAIIADTLLTDENGDTVWCPSLDTCLAMRTMNTLCN